MEKMIELNKTIFQISNEYTIEKRNGKIEPISFTKIFNRINRAAIQSRLTNLNIHACTQLVISGLFHKISTDEIEELIVETLLQKSSDDPDYDILASYIYITRIHRTFLPSRFSLNFRKIYDLKLVGKKYNRFVKKNYKKLDDAIIKNNDYLYKSMFAIRTLERLYLIQDRTTKKILETPQFMLMRVAIQCGFSEDIETVIDIYKTLSEHKYTHASPTNFNACAREGHESLASCFLFTIQDSIEDIFHQISNMAVISKNGGGIGIDITRIRSEGSKIYGTNGISDGVVPMLKHINTAARYVNQSGRRKGAFAIYLEPWHADIFAFLDLKLNTGDDTQRARDLYYALFVNDVFMDAVKKNTSWYLFNPDKVKKLCDTFGPEFNKLYSKYVDEKLYESEVSAVTLFKKILDVQLSVGNPYIVFKDTVNMKSNLRNYAQVRSSNLCVAGSTRVLTEFGYMRIDEMVDDDVKIWNGLEWSEVTIRKTGVNQPMKRLQFNNGLYLDCTPTHKFYIQQQNFKEPKILDACELKRGMILEKFNIPEWKWGKNDVGELMDNRNTIRKADEPPWQGNKKQVMDWLQRRFSQNMKVKNEQRTRQENMYAFLLSQLVNGQNDVQSLVYQVDDEITYGDTYCFTEHKRGRGVFNGLCTGQCAEICLPTLPDEIGTCNLSSLNLRQHLIKKVTDINQHDQFLPKELEFDFEGIKKTTKQCVRSLNHVLDNMNYSKKESENCNKRHRPLGIGVQGLADVFYSLRIPFESMDARKLNYRIFEHIYFAALEESCCLAEEKEERPPSWIGSVLQLEGKIQKDLWDENSKHSITPEMLGGLPIEDPHLDWKGLREKIKQHGIYNMMLLALMPTASTAQTMSNFESFEPAMSNLFTRNTMMGEFVITSSYLIKDLQKLGLWNEDLKNEIASNNGSLQDIDDKKIPSWIKDLYKTVWEIDQKTLIHLAADRGRFIDHSQSMNLYFTGKNAKQEMLEAYFLGWERGLKTGVYYLRTESAIKPFNLLKPTTTTTTTDKKSSNTICYLDSGDCCGA